MVGYLSGFEYRKVLCIGDRLLNMICSTIGTDYINVEEEQCSSIVEKLEKKVLDYGVIIVLDDFLKNCRELKKLLDSFRGRLFIITLPGFRRVARISDEEVKEYYEELVRRYVGVRVSL